MPWKPFEPEKVHPEERGKSPDYIWRFSQKRNELPDATYADLVSAFTYGTTNEALVHELGMG